MPWQALTRGHSKESKRQNQLNSSYPYRMAPSAGVWCVHQTGEQQTAYSPVAVTRSLGIKKKWALRQG